MPKILTPNLRKKVKVKRRGTRIKTPSLSPPKRTCLTKLMRDASLSKSSENESGHASRHARAHSWTTITPPSSPAWEKDNDDFKTPSTTSSSPEPPPGTPPETPKKISFQLKPSMIKSSKTDYSSDTLTDSSSSESSTASRSIPRVYRSKRASLSTSTSSSASSASKKSKEKRRKATKRKKKNESRSRSRSPKSKLSSSSKRKKKTTRRTSSSPSPVPKKKAHHLKRKRSQSLSRSCSSERKTNVHRSRHDKKDSEIKKGKDKSPSQDHSGVDSPHRNKKKYRSRSPEHDRSHSHSLYHKGHKKKQKKREESRSPSHDRSSRHSRRSRSSGKILLLHLQIYSGSYQSPRYPGRSVITQNDRQLREPSNEIVVFNFPKSCTAKELHEIFKEFGPIKEVNVARDRFTGQSRGFAFITFEELKSAKRTIEKIVDSMEIGGRRLQCNYSWGQSRPPEAEKHQYGNRKKW